MSEFVLHQEAEADARISNKKKLDQTMRMSLASPIDKGLQFDHSAGKGASVISRQIEHEDISDSVIIRFERASTRTAYYKDISVEDVDRFERGDMKRIIKIAKDIGLIQSSFDVSKFAVPNTIVQKKLNITVQYPLKNDKEKVKYRNARFSIENVNHAEYISNSGGYTCLLQHGKDNTDCAYFLRWTVTKNKNETGEAPAEDGMRPYINECVILFNNSHRLSIDSVPLPTKQSEIAKIKANINTFVTSRSLLAKTISIGDKDLFQKGTHDPTLFFLRKTFPATRYIQSNSADQGPVNTHHIAIQESHVRKCTQETAHLHWVYAGLCAVGATIGVDVQQNKLDISLLDHDHFLLAIAVMASKITERFKNIVSSNTPKMENMSSIYNTSIGAESKDYNTIDFFGYKLTQWLLSNVETCTEMIPYDDSGIPCSKKLNAFIKRVNCSLCFSAIKTIYTTDVLLALKRKTFINPWGLLYDNDEKKLPPHLQKEYSLQKTVKNFNWDLTKSPMLDKQVSVVLDITHMARFKFNAYKHKLHGSNPVVASRELEKAAARPRRNKKAKGFGVKNPLKRFKAVLIQPRGMPGLMWPDRQQL